jgi:fatty acid desaturase
MQSDRFNHDWPDLLNELRDKLKSEGCFEHDPFGTIAVAIVAIILGTLGYIYLLTEPDWPGRLAASLLISISMVQAGFLAHDAGHWAVTRSANLRKLLGRLFMSVFSGLTFAHFQLIHSRHHPRCNSPQDDPDMATGIFRLFPGDDDDKASVASWIIPRQHWLLWPLVSLQGFTLKIDSINTLRQGHPDRQIEFGLLILHLLIWLLVPAFLIGIIDSFVNYLFITWFIGPYLGAVFLVNHIGLKVHNDDPGISHMERQLTSTRNLQSGRIAGVFFGGLNNHIEHHLFPSIPMRRLSAARVITRQFCRSHDLPYHEVTWGGAVKEVYLYLKRLAAWQDTAPAR